MGVAATLPERSEWTLIFLLFGAREKMNRGEDSFLYGLLNS